MSNRRSQLRKRGGIDDRRGFTRVYTVQKKFDLAVKEMVETVREQPKSAKAHEYQIASHLADCQRN